MSEDKQLKIATIYNICGIRKEPDRYPHYVKSIQSLLDQNYPHTLYISSCMNDDDLIAKIKAKFDLKIFRYDKPHTVNITFNKTVLEIEKECNYDYYVYIDSGASFTDPNTIAVVAKHLVDGSYPILSLATDTDTCFEFTFGADYKKKLASGRLQDVPLGTACNAHVIFYSRSILDTYGRIIPDVFVAYCTESVLNYVAVSIGKRWVVLPQPTVDHLCGLDGASSGHHHLSDVHGNHWNNLLFGKDIRDMFNDPDVYISGLGYEEIFSVFPHNTLAYRDNQPKDRELLRSVIKKWLYLSSDDLDYTTIPCFVV